MSEKMDEHEYKTQLNKRLDEVIAWAVLNCPIDGADLAYADFKRVKHRFEQLALGVEKDHGEELPEPEDGGPQYINDNPAPWP